MNAHIPMPAFIQLLDDRLHEGADVMILAAVLLLALLVSRREVRKITLVVAGLFALAVAGTVLANQMAVWEIEPFARYIRWISILGEGVSLISLFGIAIFNVLLPALHLRAPRIMQDVLVAVAHITWTLVWLRTNGVDPASIVATSAVLTAVIGFSMQDTLGNILAGMAIQIDQSIHVGDWIKVDDLSGRVVETRWRYTAIETRNWETVVIPNSVLMKNKFLVLGRRQGQPTQWRRWVYFNVDFRFPPPRVIEAVEAAMFSFDSARVAKDPKPNCIQMDFTDSYCRYAVRYWLTDIAVDDPTDSEIRTHIYFALRRAGIPLSMPAHAVFLTEETEDRKHSKETTARSRKTDALAHVKLFDCLKDEERRRLAEHLEDSPFSTGEVMTHQGAEAHHLYIIISGRADVIVKNAEGEASKVAELGPGSVFGEMALMTGERRSATVIARSQMECYRLDKESFQHVLRERPELAEDISELLAARQVDLHAAIGNLDAETRAKQLAHAHEDILGQIRNFFGL